MEAVSIKLTYHLLFLLSTLFMSEKDVSSEIIFMRGSQAEVVCYLKRDKEGFSIYHNENMKRPVGSITKEGTDYVVTFGIKSERFPVSDFKSLNAKKILQIEDTTFNISTKGKYIFLKPSKGSLHCITRKI